MSASQPTPEQMNPEAAGGPVAVAVKGGGNGSRRAVHWAAKNLGPVATRFVLVHVMPQITHVPTPTGNRIPITELDADVVKIYSDDTKLELEQVFVPFKRLCEPLKVETVVVEGDDPATALLQYMSESGIGSLVLGSCSSNVIIRKIKGPGIPADVLRFAPETCDIHIVSKQKIIQKFANKNLTDESEVERVTEGRLFSGFSSLESQAFASVNSSSNVRVQDLNDRILEDEFETLTFTTHDSAASASTEQVEIEQLRIELHNTVSMYKRACEQLVHAQNEVQVLSSECLEETRRVNAATGREETLRKTAAEMKVKHLEAMKEVEVAKDLLAKETLERKKAELNALTESLAKEKIVDALFSNDTRYRRYTSNEIELATGFFSESNVIGEGGYGKVYKCSLDHTLVAVKVLRPDSYNKKEEFLREVEVLSQLHHPNMVLLLGACPEMGCLVYEYLENGSLQDHLFYENTKPPLPWFIRFKIAFETACGLAFLHNSKPDPIVHRDLKPGNILLDTNCVSKIGDVGLAKLVAEIVPDNVTEYGRSVLAGTLFYMDPEYQRTGTLRPKSDLYAFGIVILQLLTGRHPNRLVVTVEDAIANGSLVDVIDESAEEWPLAEAEELARVGLKCSQLRCRDRPDLETEVLPVLKRLADFASFSVRAERNSVAAPSHYFCPIMQEIMEDPYIAGDGFTYEHRAIKAWLEKHNVSPVTKLRLQHTTLTPNHTLRSAITDWRLRLMFSSSSVGNDVRVHDNTL